MKAWRLRYVRHGIALTPLWVLPLHAAPPWYGTAGVSWSLPSGPGPMGEGLDTGFGGSAGFGLRIAHSLEIVVRAGITIFDRDDQGILLSMGLDEHTLRVLEQRGGSMQAIDVSADLRYYPAARDPAPATRPYLLGAAGVHSHDYEGAEVSYAYAGHTWIRSVAADRGTHFGMGLGAGVRFELTPRLGLVGEGRYQVVWRSGTDRRSVPLRLELVFGSSPGPSAPRFMAT